MGEEKSSEEEEVTWSWREVGTTLWRGDIPIKPEKVHSIQAHGGRKEKASRNAADVSNGTELYGGEGVVALAWSRAQEGAQEQTSL